MAMDCSLRSPRTVARLLFVLLVAALALPLHAQENLFIPILKGKDDARIGVALANPTVNEAQINLTARSYDGSVIAGETIRNPVTLTLPASSQTGLRVEEIFGPGMAGQ